METSESLGREHSATINHITFSGVWTEGVRQEKPGWGLSLVSTSLAL